MDPFDARNFEKYNKESYFLDFQPMGIFVAKKTLDQIALEQNINRLLALNCIMFNTYFNGYLKELLKRGVI